MNKLTENRLGFRLARPTRTDLAYLDDAYFQLLVRCGYTGVYIQDSPFDDHSGHAAHFFEDFHLISLYDIAYSFERERMRDYVAQVCLRAASHGLRTFLQVHEPRLPFYAWSSTPPEWRGHGGWPHAGGSEIALCWSVPEAVAFWKQMARDALAAVPGISGLTVSMFDNEAFACDERCPRCRGAKTERMMRDILATLAAAGRDRPQWRLGLVDWWQDVNRIAAMRELMGAGAFVIGQSCYGIEQHIDGQRVPGTVQDMTMITGRCSQTFLERRALLASRGFTISDRTTWSHPLESRFLPAPPDPQYAIEKLRALAEAGVEGWYDFDCAALEPGSIAEAVAAWTKTPQASDAELLAQVLQGIWAEHWTVAREAYALYAAAKGYFPVAYDDPQTAHWSARALAITLPLVGPFCLEDFTYFDTRHQFNFFAPFNLVTRGSIGSVTPPIEKAAAGMRRAFEAITPISPQSIAMQRERDAFEIHWRQNRATAAYLRLAEAKLRWLDGQLSPEAFAQSAQRIAADEMENLNATALWLARNPGRLNNPCHDLVGKLGEIWPAADFTTDLLEPKRRSLQRLLSYRVSPPLPARLRF